MVAQEVSFSSLPLEFGMTHVDHFGPGGRAGCRCVYGRRPGAYHFGKRTERSRSALPYIEVMIRPSRWLLRKASFAETRMRILWLTRGVGARAASGRGEP